MSLKNTGSADVQVSSVQLNGSGFSWTGSSLPFVVPPGGTVSLSLVFEPSTSGSTAGTLVIASNASNSNLSVSLSGTGVQSTVQHSVTLNWTNSSSVQGYYVYRGGQTGGPYAKISPLQATSSYVDATVGGGTTYYYVVTALGMNAVESSYSNEVTAVIPQ